MSLWFCSTSITRARDSNANKIQPLLYQRGKERIPLCPCSQERYYRTVIHLPNIFGWTYVGTISQERTHGMALTVEPQRQKIRAFGLPRVHIYTRHVAFINGMSGETRATEFPLLAKAIIFFESRIKLFEKPVDAKTSAWGFLSIRCYEYFAPKHHAKIRHHLHSDHHWCQADQGKIMLWGRFQPSLHFTRECCPRSLHPGPSNPTPFPLPDFQLLYHTSPSRPTHVITVVTMLSTQDRARMKRDFQSHALEIPTTKPKRRRRRKPSSARPPITMCPTDTVGPRIPRLFLEFERNSPITAHMEWLHHLELSCENQGCYAAGCATGSKKLGRASSSFAHAHGAKTLVNGMNMFLTYHIPHYYSVSSDEEWRMALAALRSFYAFCVRRRYVKDDSVLMLALHRLRSFRIYTIPDRIQKLIKDKYWDRIENSARQRQAPSSLNDNASNCSDLGFEALVGGEMAVTLVQILENGWVLRGDNQLGEEKNVFVSLPSDLASCGMLGMSLSSVPLALRRGLWRPISSESDYTSPVVYPPDDVFFYWDWLHYCLSSCINYSPSHVFIIGV